MNKTIRNLRSVVFLPSGITVENQNKSKFELMIMNGKLIGGPVEIAISKIVKGGIRLNGKGTAFITVNV